MVLTQPWLPLPAATALALAAQLATTISVALVTSSTGFLLTWSGLLFIATAYWFVHRSATLAASPAASAVFLRLPLALCAATLWLLFLTGLSAVLPEPGSRALLMPAAGALVRSALGVEADSADEVQLRWTSGMFALGGLGALLALQALWTLLDEHRSALTGDALRSGHLGADGHRVTVVDVLLAGAAGAQPVTMPPPPVAPNAPRGGVDVEKGAAGARNGLPSRAHTHTVGRALLAPALRALLGEALLLGSQVLLLRPVAAGALFARTGGPAMGADDEGVMAGQPMGDAGNDLASLQAVASAFQGSGCAQLHAAAAARVASAALLALSLAAAVAVASGLGRYRDFWAAAASAPFPRASAQPTAAAPLFAVATPAAAASHLWWLLGALPHAALLVLLQFAAGTWLLALLQVHARADASDGRIDLAQLLEAGLASTQVGRALVSAAVCAAVFCALCLHCYRAHALRMLPLADLGAVDTGAADGGSPGLGKSSPGRSRSQLDPSLSLSSLSLSSISLLPKGLRPRPSFADAMRALLLLADEMQAENKGGAKGGRGDGWQAGSVPEGAAGGTMSLTGLAGGGESQGGLLSRTLIALGLASPVPAALSVSAPVQVRHTGHVGLSADGHFEVGLEPEMRHLLGQVSVALQTTRPKEGKEGGSPHLPAGQAKGGVSSLAMGTLHTPQQTQQQQQQTPGSTANPTPASALSCARSPFSAIASAAASSPRTPASASVAYWCLSATHERLGPFSQDELKGMWRKGAGRVQARPPGPGSAPPAAALAEAGEVDGDSIVWRAGWEGWKPLREAGSELPFVAMAGVASALGAETGDKGAGALRAAEPRPAAGIGGPMGPAAAAAAAARRRFGSSGDEPQTPVE